jgi:hypothetical protein
MVFQQNLYFFTDLLENTNYVLEEISHPPLICCQEIDQNNTIKLNSLTLSDKKIIIITYTYHGNQTFD